MAKLKDITVDVAARLTVDERTANACLKLVEIYINSAPVKLIGERKESGETELRYEPD